MKKVYFKNLQNNDEVIIGSMSKYEEIKKPIKIEQIVQNNNK